MLVPVTALAPAATTPCTSTCAALVTVKAASGDTCPTSPCMSTAPSPATSLSVVLHAASFTVYPTRLSSHPPKPLVTVVVTAPAPSSTAPVNVIASVVLV